ncbi:hypothetical protein [Kitasatospora sp. NPDC091207]|uniref:hypothetical protein n=1 Tax=Kitasatospora sp. NPDC091207 TaxID=3364083 RepID=UPI00382D1F79
MASSCQESGWDSSRPDRTERSLTTRRLHNAVALSAALLLLALTVAVVLFVARIGQAVQHSRSPVCLGLTIDGATAGDGARAGAAAG